ncbi:MAG: hypothetical protein ACRDKY_01050 [Solirubrobacteraceae bacterium]
MPCLAHIAGFPIEETLAMAAPVIGATCVAFMASLNNARRRRAHRRRAR